MIFNFYFQNTSIKLNEVSRYYSQNQVQQYIFGVTLGKCLSNCNLSNEKNSSIFMYSDCLKSEGMKSSFLKSQIDGCVKPDIS